MKSPFTLTRHSADYDKDVESIEAYSRQMRALAPPAHHEKEPLGKQDKKEFIGRRMLETAIDTMRQGRQADWEAEQINALEAVDTGHATPEQIELLGEIGIGTVIDARSMFRH